MRTQNTTIVYLLHFSEPYHHARHYLGSTFDLELRMQQHAAGQGARLLEVVTGAGITWNVIRTWDGDRKLERQLKNWHNATLLCPHPECSGEEAYKRGNFDQSKQKTRERSLALER